MPKSPTAVKIYEQQNAIEKNWHLERYFVTKEYAQKLRSFFVGPGDIIVSCAGTIGELYVLPPDAQEGLINQALMRIRVKSSLDKNWFIYAFMRMIDKFSAKFSNGSAIKNIPPFADLKNYELFLPNILEQQRIARMLLAIDHRISVQNKIIEALGGLKKAIYERIFGSDFLGATLQPLGDFMEIPKLEKEIRPDRNRLITVKLNEAGVVRNTNVESLKMSGTIYYKRLAGQFIYGKQNLFHGAFGIVPKELNGFCSSADVPSLSFNGSIEPSLLIRAISYCAYNWEKYSSGTGSKRIHETTLLGLTVPIPAKEHIGRCKKLLDLIDHKIECERKLLRLTEMQKRYLLAEMFI